MTRRTDDIRTKWADRGYVVTDADLDHARVRLAAARLIDDQQHAENLDWLRQFDNDETSAAA